MDVQHSIGGTLFGVVATINCDNGLKYLSTEVFHGLSGDAPMRELDTTEPVAFHD